MKNSLSVLIITKNNEDTIEKTIESVKDFDDIVIADSKSTDKTLEIIQKLEVKSQKLKSKVKIYQKEFDDIGKQRANGLKYVTGEWVLILDSDEEASDELKKEIVSLIHGFIVEETAFEIPFQSYFLGRPLRYGGEDYYQIRLIRKDSIDILPSLVHNKFRIRKGRVGKLKGKIHHYSYRSIGQVYRKFTDYAVKTAKIKAKAGEKSSLKKIFLYSVHMFWARFIKDKGYKDGLFRLPLDIGFAYMEFLTYIILLFLSLRGAKRRSNLLF